MPDDAQILRAIGILGHAINQEPAPNILGFRDVLAWFIHSEIPAHRILSDRRIGGEADEAAHIKTFATFDSRRIGLTVVGRI